MGLTPQQELRLAIETLVDNLKEDEGYRLSWQANISMAFKDEFSNYMAINHSTFKEEVENEVDIHEIANRASDNFLNMLCK
jgi:hypothetical protein